MTGTPVFVGVDVGGTKIHAAVARSSSHDGG
ncbi:MAG: hypothetical protein JWP75_1948, partial [Frondihabitans sp.]|nr:hypothetical protein [Frondihabitans sp.]